MCLDFHVIDVGAHRISKSPVTHRHRRIRFQSFFKTADGLFMVKGEAHRETSVKPQLGFVRCGRDGAMDITDVVIVGFVV